MEWNSTWIQIYFQHEDNQSLRENGNNLSYMKYEMSYKFLVNDELSSPVKMFLSSRQAGYSNRQQRPNLQGLEALAC